MQNVKNILLEAQNALNANELEKAREKLHYVLNTYADNSEACCWAWFFLYCAASTDEKIHHLIKGLPTCISAQAKYPNNSKLTSILNKFKIFLDQTIDNAIKNEANDKARPLLKLITDCDSNNSKGWALESWSLLEKIADSDEERINYLKKILAINAEDIESQKKLSTLLKDSETPAPVKDFKIPVEDSETPVEDSEIPAPVKDFETPVVRQIKQWHEPFRTGNDVAQNFVSYVDELIKILQASTIDFHEELKNLDSSKKHYKSWSDKGSKGNMNFFISPVIKVVMNAANALLESDKYSEAFWVANIFSEMNKVLVSSSIEKNQAYQNKHRDLLIIACCAAGCAYWRLNRNNNTVELLRKYLEKICLSRSLKTFFHISSDQYKTRYSENKSLKNEILNNSLVWTFDKYVFYLLQSDRVYFSTFVEKNLPSIFQLKFFGKWQNIQEEWLNLLEKEGFKEILHSLKKSDLLINRDDIGKIAPEKFSEIVTASRNNDYKSIYTLLKDVAELSASFLQHEVNKKFTYREPSLISNYELNKISKLVNSFDPKKLQDAEEITKKILKRDSGREDRIQQSIFSCCYDWLGYIQLKMGKEDTAEQQLNIALMRRKDKTKNFVTYWNLAVLAHHRKDEKRAFDLLFQFFRPNTADENFITVLLMLAHEVGELANFCELVSQTSNPQYFPLAFAMAYEHEDKERQRKFLDKIIEEKSGNFKLPPVDTRFSSFSDFKKVVDEARLELPVQLTEWFESRIKIQPSYIPNYTEFARVLEINGEHERVFSVLSERFKKSKSINQKREHIHSACRELLEFCRRNKLQKLGEQSYILLEESGGCEDVLRSFEDFSPSPNDVPLESPSVPNGGKKPWFPIPFWKRKTVGMFIDHENLLRSLERISRNRGKSVPRQDDAKSGWLFSIVQKLTEEFVKRTGDVTHYKVAIAFWDRPSESVLSSAYKQNGFTLEQPENFKQENAVDFKLVNEVHRLKNQANSKLKEVIFVSGDTDFAHIAHELMKEKINVQIWGGNESINQASYGEIVGKNNIVIIDDICGL